MTGQFERVFISLLVLLKSVCKDLLGCNFVIVEPCVLMVGLIEVGR